MGKKLTYEFIKNEFKIKGYELLETEYINSKIKMKFKCNNDHISYTSYDKLRSGNKCYNCWPNKKKTFEYIKQFFKDNNCELLENHYINGRATMKYRCINNHIVNTTYNSFITGRRCNICSRNQRFTFKYINDYYTNNGCELLETEYKNTITKMKYKCKNGHIRKSTFTSFSSGNRCGICSGNDKHTIEYVYKYFKDNNLQLLETEYINCMSKMKFICKNNHKSSISLNSLQKGTGCGKCKNKTEMIILEYLESIYKNILFQPSFGWCKIKKKLPFDFLLIEFNIILEIDGKQHFSQVSNWASPLFNLENDTYKANLAINNGYKLIRISQEDVFNNRFDWQTTLKENIEKLIKSEDNIIYLSTDVNLYNKHKFELVKKILEVKLLEFDVLI